MKSIEIIVPKMLIKHHLHHPENYGESLVELLNGMVTDVYTNDKGYLFTITNNLKLIEYLDRNSVQEKSYVLSNQRVELCTIQASDSEMCLGWMNKEIKEKDLMYFLDDVRLYISHAITHNSHLFVVKKEGLPVGLVGYNVVSQTGILNLDIFFHDTITHLDEDSVLKLLLHHIKQEHVNTSLPASKL